VRVEIKKTLLVESKRSTVQLATQRADSTRKVYYYSHISHLCRINKRVVHACMLNLHVCVLNRHAVWYGYNAAQSVDSTRIRVIVF
jgi:hypothetical protein